MGERQMLPRHTNRTDSLGDSSAMPLMGGRWISDSGVQPQKIRQNHRTSPRCRPFFPFFLIDFNHYRHQHQREPTDVHYSLQLPIGFQFLILLFVLSEQLVYLIHRVYMEKRNKLALNMNLPRSDFLHARGLKGNSEWDARIWLRFVTCLFGTRERHSYLAKYCLFDTPLPRIVTKNIGIKASAHEHSCYTTSAAPLIRRLMVGWVISDSP